MNASVKWAVQIDSDSRMVWDFFACRPGDAGLGVDSETLNRWRETEAAWRAMQNELQALHDANPGTELGDRLPIGDDEEVA
jgi:hypothetical protein